MKQFSVQARRVETFVVPDGTKGYPSKLDERTVTEDIPQFHVMASGIEEAIKKVHRILVWVEGVSYPGQITDGDDVWDLKTGKSFNFPRANRGTRKVCNVEES